MERATDTPATAPTAAKPATPASKPAFVLRRLRFGSLSLNGIACRSRPAIRPGDPAAWAGHHFVVDGAEQIGPILCGGFTIGAWTEQDRLVAVADIACVGAEVDDELVHTDATDVGPQPAVDQYVHSPAQSAE